MLIVKKNREVKAEEVSGEEREVDGTQPLQVTRDAPCWRDTMRNIYCTVAVGKVCVWLHINVLAK